MANNNDQSEFDTEFPEHFYLKKFKKKMKI